MAETVNCVYPYRPPKKYPKKDLHGRPRLMILHYKDFKRFQQFYVNVLGWDMIELPMPAGGEVPGSPHPGLICATGPSYETYEAVVPGHMNVIAHWAEGELPKPTIFMEVHQGEPISNTVEAVLAHGGSVVGEKPTDTEGWVTNARIADPSGNEIALWRTGNSRTWTEPECGVDEA